MLIIIILSLLVGSIWRLTDKPAVVRSVQFGLQTDAVEDPIGYFAENRSDFDEVLDLVRVGEIATSEDDFYGPPLPDDLERLSATGKIELPSNGDFFIPAWTGVPVDAGGYWYSSVSPEGRDMYGLRCTNPSDLGDGWWACGIR